MLAKVAHNSHGLVLRRWNTLVEGLIGEWLLRVIRVASYRKRIQLPIRWIMHRRIKEMEIRGARYARVGRTYST